MFVETLIASTLFVSSASLAFAQATPPPAPGGPGMMRGMGPEMPKTGFDMRMGKDNGLKVECGDMALTECISAAQPLIDQMSSTTPPPPPPGGNPPPPKN